MYLAQGVCSVVFRGIHSAHVRPVHASSQFTIPLTIVIALGPVAILTAYYRMFRPDYRDAVKVRGFVLLDLPQGPRI